MANLIEEKTFQFAKRIIGVYRFLQKDKKEFLLSKQLVRSGTSIGANVAEAEAGISRSDFHAKLYIAFKECVETLYWLKLLYECNYITEAQYTSLRKDGEEIRRILSAITKTVRESDSQK